MSPVFHRTHFRVSKNPPTVKMRHITKARHPERSEAKSRDLRTPEDVNSLAAQGILTYCTTRTLPYLCTPTGPSCLSWWSL